MKNTTGLVDICWYLLLRLDHASSCYQTSASGLTRGPFKNITYICDISSSLKLSHINHHTSMIQNTWAMLNLEWIGIFQKSPRRIDHLSPFSHPIIHHYIIKHHRNSQNHQQITKKSIKSLYNSWRDPNVSHLFRISPMHCPMHRPVHRPSSAPCRRSAARRPARWQREPPAPPERRGRTWRIAICEHAMFIS